MSVYPNSLALAQKPILKTVLCPSSPTLIELRPLCPVCHERTAFFKFESGEFAFCRECKPQQSDPNEEETALIALYEKNIGKKAASLETVEAVPFALSEGEEMRLNSWHLELLEAERLIIELTSLEHALLDECHRLESQERDEEAQSLYHDAHACHIERAELLNRHGADLDLLIDEDESTDMKTVKIPGCVEHGGFAWINVTLRWACPICGERRGEPFRAISYDGSRRLHCDGWVNPCGHIDSYEMVRAEGARA